MTLREQKKIQARTDILNVCGRLFRQKGFDETTINDIIEAVGISRQTFFNYFSGKPAVLTELGLTWLQQQSNIPKLESNSPRKGSFLAGTRDAILAQTRGIENDVEFMRLVFTRSALLFPQEESLNSNERREQLDHTKKLLSGIAEIMSAAQIAGEIRSDISPTQIAEMYVSLMLNTIRFWLVGYGEEGIGLEPRIKKTLDVLEAGLRAKN